MESQMYVCQIEPMEGPKKWMTYQEFQRIMQELGGTIEQEQVSYGVKCLHWSAVREDGAEVFRTFYVGTEESLLTYAECLEMQWDRELSEDH